jgi:hypothetical protein
MCRFRPLQPVYINESLNVTASIMSLCTRVLESVVGMKVIGAFSIKHK